VKMLDKDRNQKDIYLRAYSIKGKEGKVVGLVGTHTDITDRKRADEKLRKRDRQLRESQEASHLGSWDLDLVSQELEWSDETYKLFDRSPETYVPSFNEFARLVHPEDRATMETHFFKALESDANPYHVAVRIINDSGREWIMEAFGVVRRDSSGKALSIFGTAQDITERMQVVEALRESEKLIRNILDTVDEGFIAIDGDFRILMANKAYCRQAGVADDEVVGKHCYEVSHKSLRPCFEEGEDCAVRHVFETGEPYSATHRHPDAKGDILYVETKAFPIKDSSGAIISVIETVQNITEKYLLEEERLKTQKLEAIGTLAGGIAHDFNNLLQGVFGYISMAKIVQNDKERSNSMLDQAEKALHMSVNLTTQLLTFSKGGKPVKRKISLQSVIENSVRFALSGSSADYRIKLDHDLWQVEADEGQIGQVIQNIVINADQSMPMGGTILITAQNIQAFKKVMPQLPVEGMYMEISIKDNGIGISEENLLKIFDPYFTTKAKGSGLGLATSYSIIKNHGGAIHVSSESGKGTTFYVYLPAVETDKKIPETHELSPVVREAKILLMDDEELIRNIAREMIEVLGHEVELAEHGEEAISKYNAAIASGSPFDIVILDLTIRGGMGGRETMERLTEVHPKIRAIVSSGFSDDSVVSEYRNYGFSARLTKPYKLEELKDTLNKLLGQ
ncbi:MAG: PAS domain S-box protein, partial [Nitrospirae bacterium]|nr:PAS domain S-box protein [Nitrospirota bacterium]